jgi:hypothetical protein
MLAGVFLGSILPVIGNGFQPVSIRSSQIYPIAGAVGGLLAELFRRFLEVPSKSRAKPQNREFKHSDTNPMTDSRMGNGPVSRRDKLEIIENFV